MAALPQRSRLPVAILVAVVLAGVAAAVVLARRGGAENALARGPAGVLAHGRFRSVSWGTSGTATIARSAGGKLILSFSRGFETQKAPELFVYLSQYAAGKRVSWKLVSALRRHWGAQRYELHGVQPADLRATVEIFCAKCDKTWGRAQLAPAARRV